jgi:hypothetical protein
MTSRSSKGAGELWRGLHKDTQHDVVIRQKVDRHLLLIMVEQSKQITQVFMHSFGRVHDERVQLPVEDVVCQDAVRFLAIIAKKYCDGELTRDQLSNEKDKMMKAEGLVNHPALMKRPAAAPKAETAAVKKTRSSKDCVAKEKSSAKQQKPAIDDAAEHGEEEDQKEVDEETEEMHEEAEEENGADQSEKAPKKNLSKSTASASMKRPAAVRVAAVSGLNMNMSLPSSSTEAAVAKFFGM